MKLVETEHHELVPANTFDRDVKPEIGDRFLRLAELPTFPLDRLSRYEYLLWRQARQIVFTLRNLQRRPVGKRYFAP